MSAASWSMPEAVLTQEGDLPAVGVDRKHVGVRRPYPEEVMRLIEVHVLGADPRSAV